MVQIIIPNKVCWGNAETETAITPVVVISFLPTCCWEHNPLKQWNWFISFNKITPATIVFISTPLLCLCHQEPESNIAWF